MQHIVKNIIKIIFSESHKIVFHRNVIEKTFSIKTIRLKVLSNGFKSLLDSVFTQNFFTENVIFSKSFLNESFIKCFFKKHYQLFFNTINGF